MKLARRLTAIIEREDDSFVAFCPALGIRGKGGSIEEARANLIKALTLFFETADPSEVDNEEMYVTQVEVPVGVGFMPDDLISDNGTSFSLNVEEVLRYFDTNPDHGHHHATPLRGMFGEDLAN
jgi:predicted RNase H-like HicB family nuclease